MGPKIEEVRTLVAKHLTAIESPRSASEILAKLQDSYQKHIECGCQSCTIDAALEAETFVVIEEALKMVADSSENGVASLIYRLHLSRDMAMDDVSRIRMEQKIKMAVMRKLVGGLIGDGSGLPPGLRDVLGVAMEVPKGEEPPPPPPGFLALDGEDALAYIKSAMAGEDLPQELREKLERQAKEIQEKEEARAESNSE